MRFQRYIAWVRFTTLAWCRNDLSKRGFDFFSVRVTERGWRFLRQRAVWPAQAFFPLALHRFCIPLRGICTEIITRCYCYFFLRHILLVTGKIEDNIFCRQCHDSVGKINAPEFINGTELIKGWACKFNTSELINGPVKASLDFFFGFFEGCTVPATR